MSQTLVGTKVRMGVSDTGGDQGTYGCLRHWWGPRYVWVSQTLVGTKVRMGRVSWMGRSIAEFITYLYAKNESYK